MHLFIGIQYKTTFWINKWAMQTLNMNWNVFLLFMRWCILILWNSFSEQSESTHFEQIRKSCRFFYIYWIELWNILNNFVYSDTKQFLCSLLKYRNKIFSAGQWLRPIGLHHFLLCKLFNLYYMYLFAIIIQLIHRLYYDFNL